MHRIERDDLRHHIYVALKVVRSGKGGKGKHPVPELRDEGILSSLTDKILNLVDSNSRMVISTEVRPNTYGVCGKWGEDEPWPAGCEPGANFPPPPRRISSSNSKRTARTARGPRR
jgi:hypothetical protein